VINLRGVRAGMKHELGQIRAQGSGAILNCSSLGGLVGLPGRGLVSRPGIARGDVEVLRSSEHGGVSVHAVEQGHDDLAGPSPRLQYQPIGGLPWACSPPSYSCPRSCSSPAITRTRTEPRRHQQCRPQPVEGH
jgi:hypothetical protein